MGELFPLTEPDAVDFMAPWNVFLFFLLGISMIIRQLKDWLNRAPGGESETTGKYILSLTHSGTTFASQMLRLCREICVWIVTLFNHIEPRRKTLKISETAFQKNSIGILCRAQFHSLSYWKRAGEAGFGRSSTYADENLFSDYTCLVCGWVFILCCFNPSRCGSDFAFPFTAGAGSRYYNHCTYSQHHQL